MSIKNVEKFLNLVKSNENLQKELILINEKLQKEEGNEEKIIADNVVPLAKKNGIIFTADDFLQYANEQMSALSEEDLLNVSGGANLKRTAAVWLFAGLTAASFAAPAAQKFLLKQPTSSVTTSSKNQSSEEDSRNNQDEVNTNAKNAADKMSGPGQKSAVNNKGNEAQAGGNIDRNDNKSYKANGTEQKNRRDVMQNKNVVLPNSNAKNTPVAPQINVAPHANAAKPAAKHNVAPQANAAKPAAKNNVAQQANAAKNTPQNTEQTTSSGTVEKANRTNAAGGLFEIAAKDSRKKSDKSATPEAKVDDNKTNKSEPQATHNKEDQTKKIPTTPKMEDASNPATEAKKKNNVNSETLNKDGKIPTKIKKVDDSSKNIKDKKQKEKKEKENKETKQLEEKNKKVAPPEEKEKETLATPTAKKAAASTTAKEAVGAVREGRCGTNVNWKIEGNVLRIFGEGPMDNYASTKAPWWAARNEITEVVIGPYVTTIGNNAFFMYEKLAKVTIPKSVTSIKNRAFYGCKSLTSVKFLGVPKVGNDLFLGCNALEEVEMPATFSGGSFCGKPVKMAAAPNEEAQPAEPSVTIDVQDQIENENKEAEPKVSTDNKNGAAPTEEAAPGALEDDSAKAYGMTTAEEIHAFAEHLRNDFKLGEFFDEMSDEEGELDEDKEEYKKLDDFFENCEFSKIGGTWHGCDVSVDDVKTLVSYASQIFNVEYEEDNSTDCATYAESAQAFLDKYGLEALKACAAELREKINNGETEELPEFFKEKIEKFADEAEKLVNFYTEQGIHAFAEHLRNGFKLDEFFDKMRGENETVKDAGKEEFTKLLDFVINGKFSKEGGTWHGCDVSVDDVKTFVSYANEIIELEYEEDNSIDCATYAKSAQAFLDKYGLEALKACAAELKKKIDNGELDELPNFLAEKVEKFLADANKIIEAEERKAAQGDDQEESAVSSATIDVQDQNDNGNKSEEGSQNNDVTNKGQDDNDNGNAEEAEQEEVNSAKAPVIFYNLLDEDDDAADDDDTEKTESEIQKLAKNVKASATAKGDTAKTHEGKCGENVTWKIEGNVLHIFGKGDMQDYDDDENKAPWHAYKNEITEVVIGPDVTTIGDDAFSGCSSLTFVNIPEGVTAIGDYAFSGCSSLTSVNIPEGVTAIGDYAFSGCSSLTSVKIPDGVTKIEKTTFHGCSSLTSIEIPETVEFIEDYAFFDCSSLTSIKIPDNVANIGIHAFEGCSSLTSIKIPANVKKISFTAFSGCSSLTSVTIPEGAETIERWAFSGCSSLKSITIPASVKTIADEAFKDCSSLTSVKFLGVPSGKEYVFKLCTALKEVEMPADYKGKTFCNKPVKTAAPEEEKSSALVDSVKDNEAAESEVSSTTIDVQGQNDNDNENKEVGVKEAAQPAMLSTNLNQSSKELDSDDKFDKMLDEMDKDEDEQKQSSKFIKQNKETDDDIIDDENEDQDDNNDEINDEIIDDDEIDNEESIYNGEEDELRGAMNEDQNDNDNKNDEEAVPEEKSPEFNASGTLEAADRPDAGGSEKSDSQQAENAEAAKPEQKAYNEKIDRSSTTPQLHEVRHFYDFLKSIEDENEVVDFDAITSETVNDFKDDAQYVVTLLNSNEALRNNFGEDETDYIKYQLEDYVDISQVNDDDSNKSSVNYAEVDDDETPNWVDRNDLDKEQDEFSIEYRKIDRSKTKTKAQLGEINGFYNFLKLIENENGVVDVDAITPETVDDFEDDAQYVVTLLNSNEALRNNFGEDETGYIKSQLKGHVDVDQANYKKAGAYRASTQLDHFVDFLQKYHVSPETQETWEEELDDLDSKIRISGTKNDQPIYALYGGMKTYTNIPQKKLLFVKDLAKGVKYETWNKGFTLNLFSLVANNMLANQAEHLIGFLKKLPKIKRNLPDLSKVSRATHTKLINDIIEVGSQVKVDNQAEYMNSSNPNNKKVLCLSGRVFKNSDQSQQDLYMLRDLYRFFSQEEEISDEDDRFEEEYDKLTNEHREETQSKFIKKKVIDDDDRIDDDEDSDQVRKVAVADTVGGQEDGININDINATWKELTTYKEKEVSEDGKVEEIVKTFKEFEGQTIISYLKDKVPKAEDGLPDISAITRRNILVSYKIKFRNILEFYRKLINEIGRNIIVEDGIIYFLNSELVDGLKLTDDNLEMMLNLYYKQNNDALEFLKSLPQKKDGSADLSKGDPKLVDKLVPAINLLGEQIVYDEEVGQYKLVGEKLKKDWFGDIQVDKKTEYIKIFDFSQDDLKLLYETREALPEEQKVSFVKILNDLPKTKEEDLPDLNQVADPTTAMYLINSALSLSEQITQNRDGNYSISDEARDRFNLTDDDVKTIKILGDRQAEIEKSYNRKQMAIGIAQGLGLAAGTTVAAWAATGAPTVAGMTFLGDGSIENAKKNAKDMYKGSKLESAVNKVKSSYEGSKLESGVNKVTSTVTEVAEKAKSFKNWWYGIDEGTSPNSLNTENFNPLGQTYTTGDLSPAQLEQMFLEGQNAIKDSGTTPVDTPHIASEGQTSATGDFTVDQLNQTFLEGQKSIHTQNIEANGKTSTTEGVLPLSPNTLKVEGFDSLGKTLSETIPEHQKMSTNLLNNNFNPGGQTPSEIIPEHQKMSTNLLNANNFNPRGQTPAEEPPINVANEVIDNRVDSGKRIDSRFLTPSNPEKVNISNGTVDLPKGGPPKAEVHKSGTQVDNTVRGEKKLNDVDAKMIQNPDMNLGEAEKTGYSTSNWSEGNYIKLGKRDSEIAKSSTKAEVPQKAAPKGQSNYSIKNNAQRNLITKDSNIPRLDAHPERATGQGAMQLPTASESSRIMQPSTFNPNAGSGNNGAIRITTGDNIEITDIKTLKPVEGTDDFNLKIYPNLNDNGNNGPNNKGNNDITTPTGMNPNIKPETTPVAKPPVNVDGVDIKIEPTKNIEAEVPQNAAPGSMTGYSTSNWSEENYIKLGNRDSEIAKNSNKAEAPKSTLTPKEDANAAKIFNEYTSTGSTQVDAPHDNANAKTPSDLPPMTPKEVKKSLSKPVSKSEKLDATKVNPELTE